jgi:NTE family protein
MKRALVLSGGGARAAYQAGVLRAVAAIIPSDIYNPFPIICGTSAGALNSLAIAGRAGPFRLRIRKLEAVWRSLHAADVYRANSPGRSLASRVTSIFANPASTKEPYALLDCSPLKSLLASYVRFEHLNVALQNGELDAIAVSAISYTSGESVAFFQAKPSVAEWQRSRRCGVSTRLTLDHLMASTAIPGIFKAVKIGSEYFADGAVRQHKPLSPALRLGADKIFVIGVGNPRTKRVSVTEHGKAPSSAQVIGHLYNSAFADGLESDLESLHNINQLSSALSLKAQAQQRFREIDVLAITPSVSIDDLARAHAHELPRALRYVLDSTGALAAESNSSAASYLLFEPCFCGALMELGYRDAMTRSEAINQFFYGF